MRVSGFGQATHVSRSDVDAQASELQCHHVLLVLKVSKDPGLVETQMPEVQPPPACCSFHGYVPGELQSSNRTAYPTRVPRSLPLSSATLLATVTAACTEGLGGEA